MYAREVRNVTRNGEPHIVIVMHSVKQHGVPEVRGAIRVSDYHQSLAMKKVGKHGTKGKWGLVRLLGLSGVVVKPY